MLAVRLIRGVVLVDVRLGESASFLLRGPNTRPRALRAGRYSPLACGPIAAPSRL